MRRKASMSHMDTIIKTVTEFGGPLGKLVVIRTFKQFEIPGEEIPRDKIAPVINTIVEKAIFSEDKQQMVKSLLLRTVN